MKRTIRIMALLTAAVLICAALAACGGSKDAFAGTWMQVDEVNGNWTWTFDGSGKCTSGNEIISQDGTYSIDEKAGTATIKLSLWDSEIVYTYALTDTTLVLESTYSSYNLTKQ